MTTPLIIDPKYLRALPKSLFRSACAKCDRLQAMWEMGPADGECVFLCSLCFLYESNWGKARLDQIYDMTDAVEKEAEVQFLRDVGGRRLLSSKDGDRLLGALAIYPARPSRASPRGSRRGRRCTLRRASAAHP